MPYALLEAYALCYVGGCLSVSLAWLLVNEVRGYSLARKLRSARKPLENQRIE